MKFHKKPVVIEAVQIAKGNDDELLKFLGDHAVPFEMIGDHILVIHTLEGDMVANPGDWIIKGVQGEFYPCKPDIFKATYDPVEDAPPVEQGWPYLGSSVQQGDKSA